MNIRVLLWAVLGALLLAIVVFGVASRSGVFVGDAAVIGDQQSEKRKSSRTSGIPIVSPHTPHALTETQQESLRAAEALKFGRTLREIRGTSNTGAAAFAYAELLQRCDGGLEHEAAIRQTIARLSALEPTLTDSSNFRRLAAVQRAKIRLSRIDDCKRMFPNGVDPTLIDSAFAEAVALGDIRAKLRSVHMKLVAEQIDIAQSNAGRSPIPKAKALTADNFDLVKEALASKDAAAIRYAGPLLTAFYESTELRVEGYDGAFDGSVAPALWAVLSCDFDASCDSSDAFDLSMACGLENDCAYDSISDFWRNQPFLRDRAQLEQLLSVFRSAINSGNWSQIDVVAREHPYRRVGQSLSTRLDPMAVLQ
jgi:hypothetical protein